MLYDCRKHHKGTDVLAFFKLLDAHVPRDLAVHVVLDNLSAYMGPEVTSCRAAATDHPANPRLEPNRGKSNGPPTYFRRPV